MFSVLRARTLLAMAFVVGTSTPLRNAGANPTAAQPFRVIVNPGNPITSVDRKFLLNAYLRKTTRWPDDQPIHPVDLAADSPTRRRFSEGALDRPVSAIKSYWLQAIFSGHGVPPPELESDDQVVRFVLRTPGAVGYVSGDANLAGARAIEVR
jgi:ABC-type phosphate transport system substrate-binding protein